MKYFSLKKIRCTNQHYIYRTVSRSRKTTYTSKLYLVHFYKKVDK
jgi:hypothetical protein